MMIRLETYFDAFYVYYRNSPILKTLGQFENLGFAIMSTSSLCRMGQTKLSRVNFVTIFDDLYKIKLWGVCNNFNQFAHLSSASGLSNDVIKMAAIAQL